MSVSVYIYIYIYPEKVIADFQQMAFSELCARIFRW